MNTGDVGKFPSQATPSNFFRDFLTFSYSVSLFSKFIPFKTNIFSFWLTIHHLSNLNAIISEVASFSSVFGIKKWIMNSWIVWPSHPLFLMSSKSSRGYLPNHLWLNVCPRTEYELSDLTDKKPRLRISHMEKLLFPGKGCELWPMLGTYCHWAVRVL